MKICYPQKCIFKVFFNFILPLWVEVCAGLSRAPQTTCGICPAMLVSSDCQQAQTMRRHRGRPGRGLQDPQQTGRWAWGDRPGSREATTVKDESGFFWLAGLYRNGENMSECECGAQWISHHSPWLLVFGLQDARVENLQQQLQTSRRNKLKSREKKKENSVKPTTPPLGFQWCQCRTHLTAPGIFAVLDLILTRVVRVWIQVAVAALGE